jgi:hypothetical protein
METPIVAAIAAAAGVVTGAGISSVVTGIFSLRAKRAEYINLYYKTVLEKRVVAYQKLEALVVSLRHNFFDEKDKRRYHALFSRDDDWLSAYKLLLDINSQALWLSEAALDKAIDFNYRIFKPHSEGGAIEFGKQNYATIAKFREDLERLIAADMQDMHNIKRFLKQKADRKSMGFVEAPDGVPKRD